MGMNRSENMRRIRSKDTAPEMALRRLAHGLGYRYRLHRKDIPGKPDLVFPGRRKERWRRKFRQSDKWRALGLIRR